MLEFTSQFIKEAAFSPSSPLLRNIVGRFVGKQALGLFCLHGLGGGKGRRKRTRTPTRGQAGPLVGAPGAGARHRRLILSPSAGRSPLPTDHGVGRRPQPRPEANSSAPQLCPAAAPGSAERRGRHETTSYSQSKLGLETVHTAQNWRNWDSNPGSFDLRSPLFNRLPSAHGTRLTAVAPWEGVHVWAGLAAHTACSQHPPRPPGLPESLQLAEGPGPGAGHSKPC